MEKGNLDKIHNLIKIIEEKSSELEEFLSDFSFSSRKNLLQEITRDIIKNSKIMKDMGLVQGMILPANEQEEPLLVQSLIQNTISQIKAKPMKKVIFLRDFLNAIPEISDNDKNVILQSIKDEKIEKLKEKMLMLLKTFNLKL